MNELKSNLRTIDMLLLCETFITKINISKCKINGYILTQWSVRENINCGVVAIYTREDLSCIPRKDKNI